MITAHAMQVSGQPSLNPEKASRVLARMRGVGQPNQFVYVRISSDHRNHAAFEGWDVRGELRSGHFFLEEMVVS